MELSTDLCSCVFCKKKIAESYAIASTCLCNAAAHLNCLNLYLKKGNTVCLSCKTFIDRESLFHDYGKQMDLFLQKSFSVEIVVNDLLNLFDEKNDKDVAFYEIVFSQSNFDILRLFFTRKDKEKLIQVSFYPLYSRLSTKELKKAYNIGAFKSHTISATTRLLHDEESIDCHINKIVLCNKSSVLGTERFININHTTTDNCIFKIVFDGLNPICESKFVKIKVIEENFQLIKIKDEIYFEESKNEDKDDRDYFALTADFWHFTQSASNFELNMIDLRKIFNYSKLKTHNLKSLSCMACEFATFVSHFFYRSDKPFLKNDGEEADCHDIKVEVSNFGDCEDFTHFFLRIFNLMFLVCDYFLSENTKLLKMWNELKMLYKPFAYICEIQTRKGPSYHSTVLLIPKHDDANCRTISIEVTNPKATYDMKEPFVDVSGRKRPFDKWHLRNFFVLSFLSLHRVKNHEDICLLNVESLIKNQFFLI